MLQLTFGRLQSAKQRQIRYLVTHISPTTSLLRSRHSDNEVYLLGTAHVSDASEHEVVELIELVKPDIVFVELDSKRAAMLRNRKGEHNQDQSTNVFDALSRNLTNSPMGPSVQNMLSMAPAMLKRLGWLLPQGGEMKAALQEAERIGARCVYGDVEFNDTMNGLKTAAFGMMASPTALMKTIASVPPPPSAIRDLFQALMQNDVEPQEIIESIKTRERAKQMTSYLSICFPPIYDVMISKRDVHMARQLKEHCSKGKVVGIVGMAHVEGIEREWEALDKNTG